MEMKNVKKLTVQNKNFRELEYIHFNGAEYCQDTYVPYASMTWELTYKMDIVGEGYCGATGSASSAHTTIGANSNGKIAGWFLGAYRSYDYNATDKHIVTLDRYRGLVKIDNTTVYTGTSTSGSASYGMAYGARIDTSNVPGFYMKGNVYKSVIYNTGTTLVRNMIPVQRKSDNVCGLYDLVNSKFYPMQGTSITTAAAGPTIKEYIISGVKKIENSNGDIIWGSYNAFPYRRLEYIKFSGAEYVDTNTTLPTGTTYKRLDLKLSLQKTTGWGSNGFDSTTNQRFYMGVNNANNARFGSGSTGASSTGFTLSTNTIYNWTLWTNNGSTDMTVSNESGTQLWKSSTISTTFASAPGKLYIGALNYNGVSNYTQEKIYTVRIASNSYSGALFYGVPCQRKSDGVCGLYDTVNDVFRPMQGTTITDGAAGPVIDEYWDHLSA